MCNGHARCTKTPVYTVMVHRMDMCNKPRSTAVYQMCATCTTATASRLQSIIDERPGRCDTCRRPINTLHDVLTVEWITERQAV